MSELDPIRCPACGRNCHPGRPTCVWCGAVIPPPEEMRETNPAAPAALPGIEYPVDQPLLCPRCYQMEMAAANMQGLSIHRCPACHGFFLGAATFDFLIQRQAELAIEGKAQTGGGLRRSVERGAPEATVQYLNCPVCRQQMSRRNYAKCSGVIFDQCMAHGIWLDGLELQQILRFIATGGHHLAHQLCDEARKRLEINRMGQAPDRWTHTPMFLGLHGVWSLFD